MSISSYQIKSTRPKRTRDGSLIEPFPLEVLPQVAQELVSQASKAFNCAADLIASLLLAVLGAAIGLSHKLEIKPGWIETAALYLCIVAEPGRGKSPALKLASGPLTRSISHRITTDATIEALALQMVTSQNGIIYLADEMSGFFSGFDRYRGGKGNDRQFFQSAWSGTALKISRIQSQRGVRTLDTTSVESPFLAIFGGIQPGFLADMATPDRKDDGFLDRFLYSYPDEIPHKYSDESISAEVQREYEELIKDLISLEFAGLIPGGSQVQIPDLLRFSAEAAKTWRLLAETHVNASESVPRFYRGAWTKLLSNAARITLILHVSLRCAGECQSDDVEPATVEKAFKLIKYFASHGQSVYSEICESGFRSRRAKLLEWIAANGGSATIREILTHRVARFRDSGEVMAAFEELSKVGAGSIVTRKAAGGKASVSFQVNHSPSAENRVSIENTPK